MSSESLRLVARAGLFALAASACSPLVGAECREGLAVCGGTCVDLGTDPGHCGACGLSCGGGACVEGACLVGDGGAPWGTGDGGVPWGDGGQRAEAGPDGDTSAPDGGDGGTSDGGRPPLCGLGEIACNGACVDPLLDHDHCGGCGVACGPTQVCAGGACADTCAAPRTACGGLCVDATSDPDHCGTCGVPCASGICLDGSCVGSVAGHVVAIGHDYVSGRRGMNRVAGNAVFLAGRSPVRVVAWEGSSTSSSRAGTDAAISQVATDTGRAWTRQAVSDPARVPLELAGADVFLVYAQAGDDDAALRARGEEWSRALVEFVAQGGTVVMFETVSPANAGTWQILDAAGLFPCAGRSPTTATIQVMAPSDAVALGVPLSYASEPATVRFETAVSTTVAADGTGPVVVHRTIVP